MSGRKAAMTSKDVAKIISPTSWTSSLLTGESNAHRWTRASCTPRPILRSTPIGPGVTRQPGQDTGPQRADDTADGGAEPELGHLGAAGARRHQRHGEHAVPHDVGVLSGVGHDAHAAHRVPEEHDGTGGAGRLEDRGEVAPQLGDGAGLQGGLAGAAVPALVIGDDPETRVDERAALEHPRLHRQREPVDQHDGRGPPGGVAAAQGGRLRRVDLDVEGDPVLGRDDE